MEVKFIDHISIIVNDIKKTTSFYSNFLGEPKQVNDEKVVYKVGDTTIYFRLPMKNWMNYDKDETGLNHFAFGAESIEELKEFENLLNNKNIKNSGIIESKMKKKFIWFDDPDGYRVEFYKNQTD